MVVHAPAERAREMLVGRVVGTLMALALGTLGLVTVASVRSAHAGHVLDGAAAMWMGGMCFALAGLPLMLWFRAGRSAAAWGTACIGALVACLVMAIRTHA